MSYSIKDIARIVNARLLPEGDVMIEHLLLDSRKVTLPSSSLFFALKGPRRDGHQFINELYRKSVRCFVVSSLPDISFYPEAYFLHVTDTLEALQQLAAYHRKQFNIPVIGITGSNGKTIVKEWLYQLLQEDHRVARSPKSYNSQTGVPLSVWVMNREHTMGIFEAGISQPGEMEKLETIIRPTIGVLTNIGEAHSEGFIDKSQKLSEKMKLFSGCECVIYCNDDVLVDEAMKKSSLPSFSCGTHEDSDIRVLLVKKEARQAAITFHYKGSNHEIIIPFTDDASVQNALTCVSVLLYLGMEMTVIRARLMYLQPVNMRLELKNGINHCLLINDSYSADLSSLDMALNFLDQQGRKSKKTVILSDLLQTSMNDEELYFQIMENLSKHHVGRLIGIGERISGSLTGIAGNPEASMMVELYPSTDAFLQQFKSSSFRDEIILVKGARVFGFEKIVQLLEQKAHQTLLEINLNAIVHNLRAYQRLLKPSTRIMAMVKAFAYGSGGAEIAGILQYHKIDYLAVAYADEGVELRRSGISLPVMVMNPEENSFDAIVENNLEPEIYSFEMVKAFDGFIRKEGLESYPVHIEIETGMNRLGFTEGDIDSLGKFLRDSSLKVESVFSHLAASEDKQQDEFTRTQYLRFERAAQQLREELGYAFLRHISNSAAIVRHPDLQLDMVRLGIGLYGVDSASSHRLPLQTVATLRTTVAQVKSLEAGESVGYNRKGMVDAPTTIATVRLGYADGYPRRLGNGTGKMYIRGKLAPVIGSVCMDMTMIDVTGINGVREGDDVIVFGHQLPVQQVAEWAGTIPYEIMTGVSQRVKRVYFEE